MYAVRPLTVPDAEAFVTLRKFMLEESPWAFASSPEIDRGCNVDLVRDSITRKDSAILGAFKDSDFKSQISNLESQISISGVLVGACGLVRDEKPKRRHIAVIWGVYVAPSVRRKGLGREVMKAAIATARTWPGVECVELTVSAKATDAKRLYDSLGFTTWGVEPDALRVNDERFDETHMRLELSP